VDRQVMSPRRGPPGRVEFRRLRAGVFRLGGFLGLDTRGVVRFSEVISGRRWRQCGTGDLELVVADLAQLATRAKMHPIKGAGRVAEASGTGRG
jgi:hypothetical protein